MPSRAAHATSVVITVHVIGGPEPVIRAIDLARRCGVADVLRADDAVALELIHDPAGPGEPELELGLEERGAGLAGNRHELGGGRRHRVDAELREPAELSAVATLAVAVAEREDVLLVEGP